jgi:hypothetical protein
LLSKEKLKNVFFNNIITKSIYVCQGQKNNPTETEFFRKT